VPPHLATVYFGKLKRKHKIMKHTKKRKNNNYIGDIIKYYLISVERKLRKVNSVPLTSNCCLLALSATLFSVLSRS
jgi:hypothetical protein